MEFFALMSTKADKQTRKNIAPQTEHACKKAHYALETKLKMNGAEYISDGIFAANFRVRVKRQPLKSVFLL